MKIMKKFFVSECTGPDDENSPAVFAKLFDVLFIAGHIAPDLLKPKVFVGLRNLALGTVLMPVPKAPVDEYHSPVLLQNNIGLPGQFRAVEAVAESCLVQRFAQKYLWLCVL